MCLSLFHPLTFAATTMVTVYTTRACAALMMRGLARPGTERVEVYDPLGRCVATLVAEVLASAGPDAAMDLSEGDYLVRFRCGADVRLARLTLTD